MRSSARCAEAHTAEVTAIVQRLLATEPALLVLFESAVQMAQVHDGIGAELRQRVLMQGALAKRELLRRHRARVDAGEPSAIFGLAAMREGVDLPGAYCTHVVIAKLPFAVPTRPWEQARAEWVRRCGRSPFAELVLPEACIRLAQAVGRLIRSHRDRGTVTILDDRLVRRRYGLDLLRSLPPMRLEVFGRPTDLQALAHLDSKAVPGTLDPQDSRPQEDLR
jgi:ATP-dependent DNA helicase DinG